VRLDENIVADERRSIVDEDRSFLADVFGLLKNKFARRMGRLSFAN
jgi:hypothetical protein